MNKDKCADCVNMVKEYGKKNLSCCGECEHYYFLECSCNNQKMKGGIGK